MTTNDKGILIVVSGPSGVGKGTICKTIVQKNSNIRISVSATTRKPRSEDIDGVTYYFKTIDEFRSMIQNEEFLEWAVYNGNHYGTPKQAVEDLLSRGIDVILEIDPQGALKVKKQTDDCLFLFIEPPSFEELKNRLLGRGTECDEEINNRINAAEWEMSTKHDYDYIVINDDLEKAVSEVEGIISERKKSAKI